MNTILDYQIIETISKNQNTEIFRAKSKSQKQVILKLLREEHVDSEKLARFKKEYEVTRNLTSEWTIKTHDLLAYKDTHFMVLEDIGGISLDKFILQNSPCADKKQLSDFIEIIILIIKGLNDIHNQNTIHKDINPSNIIFNKEKGELKIIDFGLATVLKNENFDPTDESKFEGTYAYISPEQSGRVDRVIDYRTDYYSLGITFYELLSGLLPYHAASPREWIYSHIAKDPIPLNKINVLIPKEISDIVAKLMDKSADKRYQSSYGIIKDLEKCREDLLKNGTIGSFEVGKNDVSQKLIIPQKLYGRNKEIEDILRFTRSIKKNANALLLVSGAAGIGKTAILKEIQHFYKIEKESVFAFDKFDPLKRNKPYHAFIKAITQLIKPILSEEKEKINFWKLKFTQNLNSNGQLITNLIPELELIIGEQPDLPALPPSESQNRFFNTFKNLINTFTSVDRPLVIFLDDLHQADKASIRLMAKILMNQLDGSVLIIVAYRDSESDQIQTLLNSTHILKSAEIIFKELRIEALNVADCKEMFDDIFLFEPEVSGSLAELCIKKTNGTPFFIIEFLKSLHQKNQLYFNPDKGKWIVDLDKIRNSEVTENVAELISDTIDQLPDEIINILKCAACIGSRFDALLIHKTLNKPWKEVISFA